MSGQGAPDDFFDLTGSGKKFKHCHGAPDVALH